MIDVYMIDIALWVIVVCIVLGAIIWTASACCWIWIAWRERETSKEPEAELGDRPVPYWPSEEPDEKTISRLSAILFCPVCHPGGHGRCTCVAFCGDRQCTYGHTGRVSAEEAAWLRGLGIKEGTEQ